MLVQAKQYMLTEVPSGHVVLPSPIFELCGGGVPYTLVRIRVSGKAKKLLVFRLYWNRMDVNCSRARPKKYQLWW